MIRTSLLACLLAHAIGAQTLVSGGGTALQDAVDAASPGDVLLVSAGSYSGLVTQKGVTVVCDPGVTISRFDAAVLRIENVPAGQTFMLRGATIMPSHPQTELGWINGCAGTVILENVVPSFTIRTHIIQNCAQVALHEVTGNVTAFSSNVSLVDCTTSISAGGSRVSMSGGTTNLVSALNCDTFFAGDVSVTGVIFNLSGGTHRHDPDVTSAVPPALDNGAVLITEHLPATSADPFVPGTTANVSTEIGPGQLGAIAIGFPSPVVPTPIGDFWGGNFMISLMSGVAPASGILSTQFNVPATWNPGEKFVLHGVLVDSSGGLRIGPALVTVVH